MKYSLMLLLVLSTIYGWTQAQSLSVDSVTAKIRSSYEKIENVCFELKLAFKSVLSPDTAIDLSKVQYQRYGGEKRLKETFEDGSFSIFDNQGGYFFSPTERTYSASRGSKDKTSDYRLRFYPYWVSSDLFRELLSPGNATKYHLTVKPSSNGGILHGVINGFLVDLAFNSEGRISKVEETLYDKRGVQYRSLSFKELADCNSTSLIAELTQLKSNYEDVTNRKRQEFDPESLKGSFRNMDSLKQIIGQTFPKAQYYYIDFFYKNCGPCIKMFPQLKSLANDSTKLGLVILGVDPVLQDAGSWTAFRDKYQLAYTIIDGQQAQFIKQYLLRGGSPYPTGVLMRSDGLIMEVTVGFNKHVESKVRSLIKYGD